METTIDTERSKSKRSATITAPDGKNFIRIFLYPAEGIAYLSCSFGLDSRMNFVDGVDALEYVTVNQVTTYDEDYAVLRLQYDSDHKGCLERLMEDIPTLMEAHL